LAEGILTFGPFALDVTQRVLLHGDAPLQLTPKEIDVLVVLVERHGEIVDKGRLLETVWKGVCVEECNIAQQIAALRRILGDDARAPAYIETVQRRGYRFVAPVAQATGSSAVVEVPAAAPAAPPPRSRPPVPSASAVPPLMTPAPPRRGALRTGRARAAILAGAVLGLGLGWGVLRTGADPPARKVRSVVVLAFANLTGDSHQDRLAQTLTAALRSELGAVTGLRVEVAAPRGPGEHRDAGADLLVETALLDGDESVVLAAELIDARTNRLLWAETVEASSVSFLEGTRTMARAIGTRIGALATFEGQPHADRAAAQAEYALARLYLLRRTPQVVREALEHFSAAAKLDPAFALAHIGIADAYLLGVEQRTLAPTEALIAGETAARRALELDPDAAGAHAALGQLAAARWRFEEAEASFKRALELDPGMASAHERLAALLTVQDRHAEAITHARIARDLEPASPATATSLAAAHYHAGRNDAAIDLALAALRLAPRFPAAYDVLGWAHLGGGRAAEAVAAFQEAVRLSGRNPTYVAGLARAHVRAGGRNEARQLLSELEWAERERAASPLDLAEVCAALGETDEAIENVERAATTGAPWLPRVDSGLSLAALHDHARFRGIVARMRRGAAASRSD
jgi:DNA-binding winged helix-turn-helix (wHTH) protein/tetratricopeptide (TPR) repeat protein/TolB-like protein